MADDPKPKANGVKLGERLAGLKRVARDRKARIADLERENAELKAKPSADELAAKVKSYQDKERADKHKAVFKEAAKKLNVREDALDDLWEIAKLDTSAEEPDPKAIASTLGEKVKGKSYLLSDGAGSKEESKPPLPKGPGSERGGRTQSAGMTVKYSDLADGVWMRENQDRLHAAQAEGTVTYVD